MAALLHIDAPVQKALNVIAKKKTSDLVEMAVSIDLCVRSVTQRFDS